MVIGFSFLAMKMMSLCIHVEKGEGSAKYWLDPIEEVYSYGLKVKQRKEIKAIIELRINELKKAWHEHFQ
jgi:hypothetical protein